MTAKPEAGQAIAHLSAAKPPIENKGVAPAAGASSQPIPGNWLRCTVSALPNSGHRSTCSFRSFANLELPLGLEVSTKPEKVPKSLGSNWSAEQKRSVAYTPSRVELNDAAIASIR
jgi:hypothetical protein